MTDISVIILVGQEKLHMQRCMERLAPLQPRQVFVIESQPPDGTREIAESFGATVVFHAWPGLYAKQFNWALENCPIDTKWMLRLDADEYLALETIERLKAELPNLPDDVTGLNLELKRRFCGGEINHATVGIRLLRIWRTGAGHSEEREMDEHIVLTRGHAIDFNGAFYDDNLNGMDWWRAKHRGYAKREAKDALAFYRGEIRFKPQKEAYYRWPPYLRALLYFGIRYVLKRGFLDGYAGWMWNFWQGLWYRWIVDREIGRMKRRLKVES